MRTHRIVGLVSLMGLLVGCAQSNDDLQSQTTVASSAPNVTEAPSTAAASPTAGGTSTANDPASGEQPGEAAPVTCDIEGLSFTTEFQSCDMALATGSPIVVGLGLANASPGIEMAIATVCYAIQGQDEKTAGAANIELATRLDAEGVCPGNVDLLVLDPDS